MWVVKVGGSLQSSSHLSDWLALLAGEGEGKVVIVPGGGSFADQVRADQVKRGFDDATAHRKAIEAMEQFAHALIGMEPRLCLAANEKEIHGAMRTFKVPVWLPSQMAGSAPEIPQDWSVTSDSLALWLARRLEAQVLVLVKSVEPPAFTDVEELAAAGYVDSAFPHFFRGYQGTFLPIAGEETERMAAFLRSGTLQKEKRPVIRGEALV